MNRRPIGKIAPGCLLVGRIRSHRGHEWDGRLRRSTSFTLIERNIPWNEGYDPDGRLVKIRDSRGGLAYPVRDLSAVIPGLDGLLRNPESMTLEVSVTTLPRAGRMIA